MANPRQRRKTRSSTYKPVSHSRNAKRNLKKTPPIRGPKALQEAWDKHKTVKQNYAALGLVNSLNPSLSGGVEMFNNDENQSLQNSTPTEPKAPLPQGFGRIVRDKEGNVIRIEIDEVEDSQPEQGGLEMDMEQLEPIIETEVLSKWTIGGNTQKQSSETVVAALETLAAPTTGSHTLSFAVSGTGPRHASEGEVAYLQKLVSKFGGDVAKMSRDRRLNPEQRTAGELRKALRRAGFDASHSD